jgi:hypothetical protein
LQALTKRAHPIRKLKNENLIIVEIDRAKIGIIKAEGKRQEGRGQEARRQKVRQRAEGKAEGSGSAFEPGN